MLVGAARARGSTRRPRRPGSRAARGVAAAFGRVGVVQARRRRSRRLVGIASLTRTPGGRSRASDRRRAPSPAATRWLGEQRLADRLARRPRRDRAPGSRTARPAGTSQSSAGRAPCQRTANDTEPARAAARRAREVLAEPLGRKPGKHVDVAAAPPRTSASRVRRRAHPRPRAVAAAGRRRDSLSRRAHIAAASSSKPQSSSATNAAAEGGASNRSARPASTSRLQRIGQLGAHAPVEHPLPRTRRPPPHRRARRTSAVARGRRPRRARACGAGPGTRRRRRPRSRRAGARSASTALGASSPATTNADRDRARATSFSTSITTTPPSRAERVHPLHGIAARHAHRRLRDRRRAETGVADGSAPPRDRSTGRRRWTRQLTVRSHAGRA